MIAIRKANQRGLSSGDWLRSYHTFLFADYYDSQFLGYRSLRVLNEDFFKPGRGFRPHSHRDTEILTYLLKGSLRHEDDQGNQSIIRPGEIQLMSAGSGITHSEFNDSDSAELHLLQCWILPNQRGIKPGYQQKRFDFKSTGRGWLCVADNQGGDGPLKIHQDIAVSVSFLEAGTETSYRLGENRHAWLQVARGAIRLLEGGLMNAGDGASLWAVDSIHLHATETSELLLFDMS